MRWLCARRVPGRLPDLLEGCVAEAREWAGSAEENQRQWNSRPVHMEHST